MKKQRSNNKFLKIAAVSLALLALPPLAGLLKSRTSRTLSMLTTPLAALLPL